MRLALLILALTGAAGVALAQDETTEQRKLTLEESIRLAVEHNLDLQIESYNPQISLYDLNANYGAYDPTFNLSGLHSYNEAGSRLLGGGFTLPGEKQEADTFASGLSGILPWGTVYNLSGTASDTYGQSFTVLTNNAIVARDFENSQARVLADMSQPLLKNFWIDQTRLNIRVSKNRVKFSEQGLRNVLMTVITTTEQAYYNLIAARDFVRVQEKAVELATQLLQENRKRVEVGAMAPLDEKQAEAQAASSRADLIEAKYLVAIQENALKQLLTDDYGKWAMLEVVPSESLEAPRRFFNRQDSWSKGLTLRPELLQAKIELETAGLQVKYSRNQLLPQVDVVGSFGYNGSGAEFSDAFGDVSSTDRPFWSYGGRLVMPLANTRARYNYRSSKASQEQALLGVKRIEQQVMVQIDDAIKQAQSGYERVLARRAAREYAQLALEAEQKKLESGKSTSFQVLQLQRDLTEASSAELRALADYNRTLAQLSLNEGTTLERHKVDLQFK